MPSIRYMHAQVTEEESEPESSGLAHRAQGSLTEGSLAESWSPLPEACQHLRCVQSGALWALGGACLQYKQVSDSCLQLSGARHSALLGGAGCFQSPVQSSAELDVEEQVR